MPSAKSAVAQFDDADNDWSEDLAEEGQEEAQQSTTDWLPLALFLMLPVRRFSPPRLDRRYRTTKALEECARWGNGAAVVYATLLLYHYGSLFLHVFPDAAPDLVPFVRGDSFGACLLVTLFVWLPAFAFFGKIQSLYAKLVRIARWDQGVL